MAYGDKKVIVDVRDGEHGEIIYKDEGGKEHKYYPKGYAHFFVDDIQTLVILRDPSKEQTEPQIVRRIRGTARLEDRGLCVVGDPASLTKTLSVSFEVGDWRPKRNAAVDNELGTALSTFLGGASLGFNRRDWEIGNDDEWWAACYLPQPFMEQLEAAIASGRLASVSVGLSLYGLYSDEGDWAPVSSRSNLFIRPDRKDNDIMFPQLADGFVSSIMFATAKVDLRQPPVQDSEEQAEELSPSPITAPENAVAAAIVSLAARIDATRSTMKWIGGLIVVALLFVSGR